MRILNAGDKCTQLDLNSKLIGDLFLIINVFSFSLKEQTSFRTEITVPQIHIYTLNFTYQINTRFQGLSTFLPFSRTNLTIMSGYKLGSFYLTKKFISITPDAVVLNFS